MHWQTYFSVFYEHRFSGDKYHMSVLVIQQVLGVVDMNVRDQYSYV